MIHVLGCITGQHDLRLVVLAGFLCGFACWSAMQLLSRARLNEGRQRALWTVVAGSVFGAGIWATHFVAMLAYRSIFPLGYDVMLTILSIGIAMGLSSFAFFIALRPGLLLLGAAIAGAAISAMHYTGMAAITGPFRQQWDMDYVAASLVVGIGMVMLGAQAATTWRLRGRIAGAALWTLGICGMHFTGMSALTLRPDPTAASASVVMAPELLAVTIAAVAILIIALGLIAAMLDNHLALRRSDEAARLHLHIAELEATQKRLETTSRDLSVALENAAAANTAKSAFLAAMSHELRTPLNAIIGFSEIMQAQTFGPVGHARYEEYICDILKSGTHLLSLINEILDLTRIQSGQADLKEDVFPAGDVIAEALRMVAPQAAANAVLLINTCGSDLPQMRADRRRICQVLLNLLANAIKFTPQGGSVTVRCESLACGFSIEIRDTGIGIAREDIPRAMDWFGQVDSRIARRYDGAGLGLPLSVQLMELHGGSVGLASELGVGTTVTMTFPPDRIFVLSNAA